MADVYYYPNTAISTPNKNELDTSFAPLAGCPPPSRQRRSRTMFTDDDIRRLEDYFIRDPYPDIYGREQLAGAIGVPEARIQTWFQNKRSRTRRRINNKHSPPGGDSPTYGTKDVDRSVSSPTFTSLYVSTSSTLVAARDTQASQPVFPLQAPPSVRHNKSSSPVTTLRPAAVPTPPRHHTLDLSTSGRVTPVNVRADKDADDSGVLDLSIKSNESPKEGASPTTKLPHHRLVSPGCGRVERDGGRPFFTPWAPTTAPTYSTPTTAVGHNTGANSTTSAAINYSIQNPWMYGFASTFNSKDGVYYFQPLPTSPYLSAVGDSFLSPGLTPLVGTPTAWSPSILSPSIRTMGARHFVFPDVTAPCGTMSSPPTTPVGPGSVTPSSSDRTGSPPGAIDGAPDAKDNLTESPGSDTGSRSSGYSSRESDTPIDVCN